MQTIKSFVHTKDYTTFLIQNTVVWNSLKTRFTEDLEQATTKLQESFIVSFFRGKNSETRQHNLLRKEIIQKLSLVQQRLELIQNEWNRLQYYVTYKHEQIELHPELVESFFSYIDQELKSNVTFH